MKRKQEEMKQFEKLREINGKGNKKKKKVGQRKGK